MSMTLGSTRPKDFGMYAFTYNKNYPVVSVQNGLMKPEDYEPVLAKLRKYGEIKKLVFEIGNKQKRLHVHGIVELPDHINKFKICHKGFHLKLDELYDEVGWKNYIMKDHDRDSLFCDIPKYNSDLFKSSVAFIDDNVKLLFPAIPKDC